jgi:hypothetical protein
MEKSMTDKQAKSLRFGTPVVITRKSKDYYSGFTLGKVYNIKGIVVGIKDKCYFEFAKDDNGHVNDWPVQDCEIYGALTGLLYGEIK